MFTKILDAVKSNPETTKRIVAAAAGAVAAVAAIAIAAKVANDNGMFEGETGEDILDIDPGE